MNPKIKCLVSVLCCAALTACAADMPRLDLFSPSMTRDNSILAQAHRIHGATPAELATEEESLQKAYAAHRTEQNRLRLALFLAMAPTPQGDRTRALALFDVPPSELNGQGRNHPLAQMFLPLLQDYRRLDEGQNTSQQKLRELQLSNDQMHQKLDALRDIETRIQERPKAK